MQSIHSWLDLWTTPRPKYSGGSTRDTLQDRLAGEGFMPSQEALFTQSNARVLVGLAANGSLRLAALPTQIYPAPTACGELNLGPGMYHKFDVVMYAGNLHYSLELENHPNRIDLAEDSRENRTFYADHFLPMTEVEEPDLQMAVIAFAPLAWKTEKAALAPAPLPGPNAMIYALYVKNTGDEPIRGKVILHAGDRLLGHYEDAAPERAEFNQPEVSLRQRTLILSRPFGAAGVHLHEGNWKSLQPPFQSERSFTLAPGEETVFDTYVALGSRYAEIMPAIYRLHLHPTLEWISAAVNFWAKRLGELEVGAGNDEEEAQFSKELYYRCIFDNFNCLQTDEVGNLIAHWQGAPSHGYGVLWGIDVEPTVVSIANAVPELARSALLYFMKNSRAPIGAKDHSLPILVAPLILARRWLEACGDIGFLKAHPEILIELTGIMDEVLSLKAPDAWLFPSRYSSDGPVGRKYDYGTNVKVFYAFNALGYLLRLTGREDEALKYEKTAVCIQQAIEERMVVDGPFGRQISGGTNAGEDPGTFYLPEDRLYYDGEDTSSMLAPIYGACDFDWQPWVNYHRFARSLWCPNYDPEFGALNWQPAEPAVLDGTAFFSRLGGSVTPLEMKEALTHLRRVGMDEATGSVFWWGHGMDFKRRLTRCSQGQGAWAWQYLEQWLGVRLDCAGQTLSVSPRGLLDKIEWKGLRAGDGWFDLAWEEKPSLAAAHIHNHTGQNWRVRVGFRQPGSGALGGVLWQEVILMDGESVSLQQTFSPSAIPLGMPEQAVRQMEIRQFGKDGVLFKRYGPAMLWGHWETAKLWDFSELPNALRFVIGNGTGEDWREMEVTLDVPPGWQAFPRQPLYWTRPTGSPLSEVHLQLGGLSTSAVTTAPFWIIAPGGKGMLADTGGKPIPFHMPTQPGEGLRLTSPIAAEKRQDVFRARLRVVTAGGREWISELDVPVEIIPGKTKGAWQG